MLWREPSWCSLYVILVTLCFGYQRSTASEYTAANVSFEMPLALTETEEMFPPTMNPSFSSAPESELEDCCTGTLGYASSSHLLPYPCARSRCCDEEDTVAVIPVDEALGFKFACMPKTEVRTLCYEAGSDVYTSNQDPDYVPRMCCEGARFSVLLNRWYAAMTIKCVDEEDDYYNR